MNSTRFKKDSIRFKKEASLCELAAKLANFLEFCAPVSSYEFSLPDLLHFSDEIVLNKLRENPTWQALEAEFVSQGGIISEDWDDEEYTQTAEKPVNIMRQVHPNSRLVGIAVLIILSAILGGLAGYMFPQGFQFPNLSEKNESISR